MFGTVMQTSLAVGACLLLLPQVAGHSPASRQAATLRLAMRPEAIELAVEEESHAQMTKQLTANPRDLAGEGEHGLTEEGDFKHIHVHDIAWKVVVPVCVIFMTVFVLNVQLESWHITWLPESLVTILVGTVFGIVIRSINGKSHFFDDPEVASVANATFLNLVLLPVIIFESGWTVRHKDFQSQFGYILLFGIVGTLISTFGVFALIYMTGQWGLHRITGIRTSLCFASLISATDPVAILGTYSSMKVDPLLNIIVFGEALINDAVAIVLFKLFNSNTVMGTPGEEIDKSHLLGKIVSRVSYVFFGSIFAGICCGIFSVLVLRFAKMKEVPKLQVLYITMVCYLSYAIAEGVGLSGIISTLFCAILMGIYARPHMSSGGLLMSTVFIKQMATMADTAVFVLVGIAFANIGWSGLNFGMWCIPICLIARALATFPMGGITNILKRTHVKALQFSEDLDLNLLSLKHLFMIWHGGLRGGIALVLSMEIGEWANELDGPGTKMLLQSATFVVIVVFLLVFGGSTSFFLKYLGIPTGVDAPDDALSKTESSAMNLLNWVSDKVLEPTLVGNVEEDKASSRSVGDVEDVESTLVHTASVHRSSA